MYRGVVCMVCVQKKVVRTWRKEVLNLSSKGLYEKLANEHFILEYIKIMDSRNIFHNYFVESD